MLALVACSALLALEAPEPPRDYAEARQQAGRTPEGQVRLALWCEAHGLPAERLKHLAMAIIADPANATARGLMGLVEHGGRWRRPEDVAVAIKSDPALIATLAEYDARRQRAAYQAEAQFDLGIWCEEHGLKDQARAHLTAVTRLDPSRELAWKKLGCRRRDGRWVTDAQLAAEKADAEARKAADRKWRPLLERWKGMLAQPSRRDEARQALLGVTDPLALPTIAQVFLRGDRPVDPAVAVPLLGQIDSPASSRLLASLAVSARSAEGRRVATEVLRRRDPREFARMLIDRFEEPIPYEVRPVAGPGSAGALVVRGKRADLRRLYSPPPPPPVAASPGDSQALDADGLLIVERPMLDPSVSPALRRQRMLAQGPGNLGAALDNSQDAAEQARVRIPVGRMKAEADRAAASAREQLARDVAALEGHNRAVRDSNAAIARVLNDVTGQALPAEARPWDAWYLDQLGFRAGAITAGPAEKPTLVEDVPLDYVPGVVPVTVSLPPAVTAPFGAWGSGGLNWMTRVTSQPAPHTTCFAAGTPVRTIDGPRPIEAIRTGDLVLVQDTRSGGLSYRPVVAPYHNPPDATFRVGLGEDAVVATGIHRFWVARKGWAMTRDLKPGDEIRALGGVAVVSSVEADRVRPVFNLEVAEGHDFFVGKAGVLVHDNSPVEATPRPFDAPSPR